MAPVVNPAVIGRQPYVLPRQEKAYRHKLDIGENLEPISPDVANVLTAEKVHLYPAHDKVYSQLKLAVQNYCGVEPNEDNLIFTNGSDNALKAIIEGYFLPQTKLLIPIPTYPHFVEFARNARSSSHPDLCFLRLHTSDTAVLQEALRKETFNLCYLCSPNLPLGYSFTTHQLYELLDEFQDTMFIVDEAYIQYSEHYQAMRQAASAASLIPRYRNLIVTSTFSKAFGLAGLRIGYLLTHPCNVSSLEVLVNHKSVTSLAMRAALETIEQLPYYNAQIAHVQNLKKMLRDTLTRICHAETTPIYGYNIAGGNFFLLFAKDTTSVCRLFEDHGIFLRDKSSEIPNAIRSCIGTERQMKEVLLLVAFINQQALFRIADLTSIKVIIDMDNTLRDGSKSSSPWHLLHEEIKMQDWIVCTNNSTETPDEFQRQIEMGMKQTVDKVVSPLTLYKANVRDPSYVIGSVSVKDFLQHTDDPANAVAVLVTQIPASHEEIITICKLYHEYDMPIFHTDSSQYTSLASCAEVIEKSEKTIIPDLGSYMKMMNVHSTCIDKASDIKKEAMGFDPTFDFSELGKQIFVIGDSLASDKKLADSLNGSIFLHVNPTLRERQCDLDQMYISIPSIEHL